MKPIHSRGAFSVLILAIDGLGLAILEGRRDVGMVAGLLGSRGLLGEASEDLMVELSEILVAGGQRRQGGDRRHDGRARRMR